MNKDFKIKAPFFEVGPKAFLYGESSLVLALWADEISRKYDVDIIYTPQSVDIYRIAKACPNLKIFAQHMDAIPVGRGVGSVLPEAVKEAGAVGVMLNHAEKPLTMDVLEKTIQRADEVGLATLACAGSMQEVAAVAKMTPNILLAEAPELIGTGARDQADQEAVHVINETVKQINPHISVLHGAGISNEKDVYDIIMLGADATGSTSGILKAPDPHDMLEKMIKAVREAWNKTHQMAEG